MSFFKKLFSRTKARKEEALVPKGSRQKLEDNTLSVYERLGLTKNISPDEKALVSVITSAIVSGDSIESQVKIKNVVKIDTDKIIAAVITTAIASNDSPNSTFKIKSIKKINNNEVASC